jgi:hypothetical protein
MNANNQQYLAEIVKISSNNDSAVIVMNNLIEANAVASESLSPTLYKIWDIIDRLRFEYTDGMLDSGLPLKYRDDWEGAEQDLATESLNKIRSILTVIKGDSAAV